MFDFPCRSTGAAKRHALCNLEYRLTVQEGTKSSGMWIRSDNTVFSKSETKAAIFLPEFGVSEFCKVAFPLCV